MLVLVYEDVIQLMRRAVPTFVTVYGFFFPTEWLDSSLRPMVSPALAIAEI